MEKLIVEKPTFRVGDRVEKLCAVCSEERGHVVSSVTKRGQISRVTCPKCSTLSSFRISSATSGGNASAKVSDPYDWTRTYRTGQTMMHSAYGFGEVTALIEPQKIDVLFEDKMRRLIHARTNGIS